MDQALDKLKSSSEVDLEDSTVDLMGEEDQHPHISTGSIVLNNMIGGNKLDSGKRQCPGIPRGKITEVFGQQRSGKTTLGIETAVKCQSEGGSIAYLDYENALVPEYAKNLGLRFDVSNHPDRGEFRLFQPRHWEEGSQIIEAMIDAEIDLIIVDSVAAMKPKSAIEDDSAGTGQIGHLARLMSDWLPQQSKPLKKSGAALVFINQLRSKVNTSRYSTGPDEETTGGRALKYYTSLRIKLNNTKTEYTKVENDLTGEKEKQPVSNIVKAKNVKNKITSRQGHRSEFVIRYGEGIDNIRSVIDIASRKGVINQAGPWYKFRDASGEEEKCQGKESLREHFIGNKEDFQSIVNQVSGFSKGYGGKVDADDDDIEVEETGDSS
jgi:recombination protein RecA